MSQPPWPLVLVAATASAAECLVRRKRMEKASEQFRNRGFPTSQTSDAVLAWIEQQQPQMPAEHQQGLQDLEDAARNMSQSAAQLQEMLSR